MTGGDRRERLERFADRYPEGTVAEATAAGALAALRLDAAAADVPHETTSPEDHTRWSLAIRPANSVDTADQRGESTTTTADPTTSRADPPPTDG